MRDRSGPESSRELVGTSKKFKFSEVGRDATNCKPGFGVCATGRVTEVVMSGLRTLSPKYSLDSTLLGDHNILRGLWVQLAQKMTPDQLPTGRETVGSIFAKDATNWLSVGSIFLENLKKISKKVPTNSRLLCPDRSRIHPSDEAGKCDSCHHSSFHMALRGDVVTLCLILVVFFWSWL